MLCKKVSHDFQIDFAELSQAKVTLKTNDYAVIWKRENGIFDGD